MVFLPLLSSQLQIPQHKGQWSQTPWLLPAKRSVKRQAHHIWLNWTYYSIQFHQFHQCSSCNGVLQEVCLQKIRIRNKPSTHQGNVCMATSSAKKKCGDTCLGHGKPRVCAQPVCQLNHMLHANTKFALSMATSSKNFKILCCFMLLSSAFFNCQLCKFVSNMDVQIRFASSTPACV